LALFLVGAAATMTTVSMLVAAAMVLPASIHELAGEYGVHWGHQVDGNQQIDECFSKQEGAEHACRLADQDNEDNSAIYQK